MKRELNLLFNALLFYTRFPVPVKVVFSEENLSKSFRYFPLAGTLSGGVGALVYYLCCLILPHSLAIASAIIVIILLTGAMHEDGLSDFLDGFGGGRSREDILRIMKESTIGVYGVLGVVSILFIKYLALNSLPKDLIITTLIGAHSVSRLSPIMLVNSSTYVRERLSKASHTRLKTDKKTIAIATIIASAPLLLFNWKFSAVYILLSALLFIVFRRYLNKRLGGFTGDTLGALQQLNEVLFYLVLIASIKI
ncbi:MAG: adenosylcobinamide-GDP ribazoletransferase [Bacteroidales bacterium]|nr:adenosylcobinamide-GDP ribazoletransferase [Bacteroidales bacterium]